MPCMGDIATTPFEALWATLSTFLGFLVCAVAAHPLAATAGILYVVGVLWFGIRVGALRASEEESPRA
jgi:predicted membrane channel-forming protein YqfA (hemolysin III family)